MKGANAMGLIKAGIGALGGTLADQWKEFFYCDALDDRIIAVKGRKQISGRSSNTKDSEIARVKGRKQISGRSSNTKGNDNIISSGSGDRGSPTGKCMIIVEQGKVVEVCAEPGEYIYDKSTEPSIFSGNLGKSIIDTFKTIGKRFSYGRRHRKRPACLLFSTQKN